MREVEAREFDLLRRVRPPADFPDRPVVHRTKVLELERAYRMRHSLDRVLERMRVSVQRINAPLISRVVMCRVLYPVDDRISHIDIRRCHIYLSPEHHRPVFIFSVAHLMEELHALFGRSVAVRAVLPRLLERASLRFYFFISLFIDEGFSFSDQLLRRFIHRVKVIRRPADLFPFETEPLYVTLYGFDIFLVFFRRVRIIEP